MTEKRGEKQNVGFIQLNRPKALNALCDQLMAELQDALDEFETDSNIGSIVITGSERAFAGNYNESLLFNSRIAFEICYHHHQLWCVIVIIIFFVNVVTMIVFTIPLTFVLTG